MELFFLLACLYFVFEHIVGQIQKLSCFSFGYKYKVIAEESFIRGRRMKKKKKQTHTQSEHLRTKEDPDKMYNQWIRFCFCL